MADDEADSGPPGVEAGAGAGGSFGTGGTAGQPGPDAQSDVATALGPTNIIAVHASPNLFDFRICLKINGEFQDAEPFPSDPDSPMPHSNLPGVPVGGAVNFDAPWTGFTTVIPYVINAETLVQDGILGRRCESLVGDTAVLTKDQDYYELNVVRVADHRETTQLLVVHGCASGASTLPGRCSEPDPPALARTVVAVSPAEDALLDTSFEVMFAHLSPSLAEKLSPNGILMTFGPPLDVLLDSLPELLETVSGDSTRTAEVPTDQGQWADLSVGVANAAAGGGPGFDLSVPLATIQSFAAPNAVPDEFFTAGSRFVFALVGDASDAAPQLFLPGGTDLNPEFDGRGLHILAIPVEAP